jgi:hypothetical protein
MSTFGDARPVLQIFRFVLSLPRDSSDGVLTKIVMEFSHLGGSCKLLCGGVNSLIELTAPTHLISRETS